MTVLHAVARPDELPEWLDAEIAELLRVQGLHAFIRCHRHAASPARAPGEPQVQTSLLRFTGGVLKLTRGRYPGSRPARHFVAIDFHDFRAAVLDPGIVQDAYLRFAAVLQEFASCQDGFAQIEVGCCPCQGTAFISVESLDSAPSDEGLGVFLMQYFAAGRTQADLHQAFGDATIAFARATVPSLVATVAM